jgi:hypothetical protein
MPPPPVMVLPPVAPAPVVVVPSVVLLPVVLPPVVLPPVVLPPVVLPLLAPPPPVEPPGPVTLLPPVELLVPPLLVADPPPPVPVEVTFPGPVHPEHVTNRRAATSEEGRGRRPFIMAPSIARKRHGQEGTNDISTRSPATLPAPPKFLFASQGL